MNKIANIIFMGSPDFSVRILETLANNFHVSGVVTQPDRPAGRHGVLMSPPVKLKAFQLGIPVIQPGKLRDADAFTWLKELHPDVIVVAAYGQILKSEILELPPFGCINVHGSLLPRWRGASPIHAAILSGDDETGITIMKMDPGVDTGPILSKRSIPISQEETSSTLSEKLSLLGAELLVETLPKYLAGEITLSPQTEQGATYAKMIKKADGLLDFNLPAEILERKIRAFQPWPGAYFEYEGSMLKILKSSVYKSKSPGAGVRTSFDSYPAIGTGQGILILNEIHPAGKNPMDGKVFLLGSRNWEK